MSENSPVAHDAPVSPPSYNLFFTFSHRLQMTRHLFLRPSFELQAHWEVQPSLCLQPGKEAQCRGDWTWVIHQLARLTHLLTTQVFEYGFNLLVF